MKKTGIYLVLFFALLGASVWLISKDNQPSEDAQKNFQTPEILELTKVELKDRNGNYTVLNRRENNWFVDDVHPASEVTLNDFFYAIEHMVPAYPAPNNATDNIIKAMVGNSTKVFLYKGNSDKPFKVFVVGGPNHNQDGTYMLMEVDGKAAEKPYLVQLPGFKGYIGPRFTALRKYWIGSRFTNFLPEEIKSLRYTYLLEDSSQSFILQRTAGSFEMINGTQTYPMESLNVALVQGLFSVFMDLNFEQHQDSIPDKERVINELGFLDLEIELTDGNKRKVSVYKKPYPDITNIPLDAEGNRLEFDKNQFYAFDYASESFFTAQYFSFGKVFVKAEDILKK